MKFELIATDAGARRGRLHTAHGSVETPAFMPVGTAGTVKGMTAEQVAASGAEMVLANTYHLMLRPGAARVERLGGLHKFMNWKGPILTDSGGFQVMSLASLRKIDEDGVSFRSHIDGAKVVLTPESSIEIQRQLDADVTMVFDECTPFPVSESDAATSMRRSMRWAERSKAAFTARPGYGLFGIVQGSTLGDLREESASALKAIGFEGYAIGGLAVGEGQEAMFETLDKTVLHLPADAPRYLMGVGKPGDILGAVARGVDLFDCVLPTRSGRTGQAFIAGGTLNIRNACHADDDAPIDDGCACYACSHHSRAYLHHLFKAKEMLGPILLTTHNLTHYQDLMRRIRASIEAGSFNELHAAALDRLENETAPVD